MGERDAAQAEMLIRALCDLRNKMIGQMTWLEKHDAQLDAAALQRDINEAQAQMTRLQNLYLGGGAAASLTAEASEGRPMSVGRGTTPSEL